MGKKSQATQQMTKGGVSGRGSQTTHDNTASSGDRGKYRGGSTGAKKAMTRRSPC